MQSDLQYAMQLLPLLIQVMVGVPPPLLSLHELRLQRALCFGISGQQQAPASLHGQDVNSMLPLKDFFFELETLELSTLNK